MSLPVRLVLALGAGVCLWLAFPGHDLWPLALVGLGVLSWICARTTVWRGAALGLVTGLACFVPLLSWSGIFVGWLPWIALAVAMAAYVAAAGLVAAYLQRDRVRPLVFAVVWVVAELARSHTPFGGFPWGRVGFSQADSPLLGLARWLGTPGLGFAAALTGALLALAVDRIVGTRDRRSWLPAAIALGVLLAPLAIPRPVDGPLVNVVGVQGNVPRAGLDFNAERRKVLDNHAGATEQVADQISQGRLTRPDLVLWPENASDIDPTRNPDAGAVIERAVEAVQAPIVLGALLREPPGWVSNAALLYLPGSTGPVQQYVKQRPVPFAERIPWRGFFRLFSDKVDLVRTDFSAGSELGVLQVPVTGGVLPLGVAICFEVIIDDLMRDTVLAGAEVMFLPTNNATFGYSDESVQQLAASRVKAVELGRSVVHVSTVGVSGLITPDGQVHERTELFTQAVIAGEVPRRTELTPAVILRGWPERVAALALLVLVAVEWRSRRVRLGSTTGGTANRPRGHDRTGQTA